MERVRNKNQHYDAWLHWNVSSQCNFNCEYCFGNTTPNTKTINEIKVDELLSTLEKTGLKFRISFTGGEPFLIPNFTEACRHITQNHYVSVNSNLVLDEVLNFAQEIEPGRVLTIHASLHLEELKKKNLLNKFINNYKILVAKSFNIYAEAVAYPSLFNKINEYKEQLSSFENEISYAPFYGIYNNKSYPEDYTDSEINAFHLDVSQINAYAQKGSICNAGYNAAVISPKGKVSSCFQIGDRIGDIYSSINFKENLTTCPSKKCGCPLNFYDKYLFKEAKLNFNLT